jgi:Mn2+/Fe2+ NRAMP family transporter
MDGLSEVPGPRLRRGGNWIVWYWFLMFMASISQLGGIVGAVGQALAISAPLTERGRTFNEYVNMQIERKVRSTALARNLQAGAYEGKAGARIEQERAIEVLDQRIAVRDAELAAELGADRFQALGNRPPPPPDDKIWASLMAVMTAGLLVAGRYRLIQAVSTTMVATFTLVTIVNLCMLQSHPTWSMTWSDIIEGMRLRLPPGNIATGATPVATALATFGIIGVGASELVAYPYWCLEKGYARFTGPREPSSAWGQRARGWMRVMRWDAWCSMFVYTFATVAFYLLGAATLGRSGLDPQGSELIQTLSVMYQPVFGSAAQALFLFGAFAVLYSTFFVANAGHARVFPDALRILGLASRSPQQYRRLVKILSGVFPMACLIIYLRFPQPAALVLLSGVMQAIMLPMLALAALFFRYRRCDPRVEPGRVWDGALWISAAGMFVAGIWTFFSQIWKHLS